MFSATWPSSIQKLAAEFLCNPVKVTIGSQDLSASHSVTQVPCPALPCPALPCPALPCPALPCPALPCPAGCPCAPSVTMWRLSITLSVSYSVSSVSTLTGMSVCLYVSCSNRIIRSAPSAIYILLPSHSTSTPQGFNVVCLQQVLRQVLHVEYAAQCSITAATLALSGNFVT